MDLEQVIGVIIDILNSVIPIVVALSLLSFVWGLAQFIRNSGDTAALDEGKSLMKWGVLALFVSVSVWGIVNFLFDTFFEPKDEIPVDVDSLII